MSAKTRWRPLGECCFVSLFAASPTKLGRGVPRMKAFRRYYFPVASFLLLALTISAFADNLFTDVGQLSNFDPKFIIHGLLCGAWMILLFVQSSMVSSGNLSLHRKLGMAGLVIAIGVTLSTIWLFIATWKGLAAMNAEVKANRLLLPSYSLFVALAYTYRKQTVWHKRLMFAGTLFMLDPVLARFYDPIIVPAFMSGWTEPQIDAAFLPWFFATWLAFFFSLVAYDVSTLRRVHPVTLIALLWFGAVWILAFLTPGPKW
jgi:hypothetical protein